MTEFDFPEQYLSWASVPVNYLRAGVSRFVHGGGIFIRNTIF